MSRPTQVCSRDWGLTREEENLKKAILRHEVRLSPGAIHLMCPSKHPYMLRTGDISPTNQTVFRKLKKKYQSSSQQIKLFERLFLISFHILKCRQFSLSIPSSPSSSIPPKPHKAAPWRRRFVPSRCKCRALTLDHGSSRRIPKPRGF